MMLYCFKFKGDSKYLNFKKNEAEKVMIIKMLITLKRKKLQI